MNVEVKTDAVSHAWSESRCRAKVWCECIPAAAYGVQSAVW